MIVPVTLKSMSVDVPGGVALANVIAARSEPGPVLARLLTTIKCENAGADLDVPGAWAAAGRPGLAAVGLALAGSVMTWLATAGLAPAGLALAAHVQVITQAAAAARARIRRPGPPGERKSRCGNPLCVVKANIACLLPWAGGTMRCVRAQALCSPQCG